MRTDRPAESAFRTQLRRELDRLGWSQSELERRSGLKRGRVSLLLAAGERQRRVSPTADDISAIAGALGRSTDWLLGVPAPDEFPGALRDVVRATRGGLDAVEALIGQLAGARSAFSGFDLDLGADYAGVAGVQQLLFEMLSGAIRRTPGDAGRFANVEIQLDAVLDAAELLQERLREGVRTIDPAPENYPPVKSCPRRR